MICIQDNQQLSRGGGVAFSSNLFSTQTNTERLYLGGDAYSAPAIYVKEGTGSWKTYYNVSST